MILGAACQLWKLRRAVWLAPDELKALQARRLQALIRHAYQKVPYYRQLFDSVGVRPEHIRTVDDLRLIPITTKAQLQNTPARQLMAAGVDPQKCLIKRTSGSTGMPLQVYVSPSEKIYQTLINTRILLEDGLRFWDELIYFGDPRHFPERRYWFQTLGLLRREYLSIFDDPPRQADILRRNGAATLYGYATHLEILAFWLREKGIETVRPRQVFTTAEVLTEPGRATLKAAFGLEPFDVYGCVEMGDIAWECDRHEGLHLNIDCLVPELIKNGEPVGPGEMGKLVCTSLHSYAMPLIRLEIGDVCTLAERPCSCGRGLPLLSRVEGRRNDILKFPGGRFLTPNAFTIVMRGFQEVSRYRVRQEQEDRLSVQLMPRQEAQPSLAEGVRAALEQVVGEEVTVEVTIVSQIERDRSGKIRSIISRVPVDF